MMRSASRRRSDCFDARSLSDCFLDKRGRRGERSSELSHNCGYRHGLDLPRRSMQRTHMRRGHLPASLPACQSAHRTAAITIVIIIGSSHRLASRIWHARRSTRRTVIQQGTKERVGHACTRLCLQMQSTRAEACEHAPLIGTGPTDAADILRLCSIALVGLNVCRPPCTQTPGAGPSHQMPVFVDACGAAESVR